MLTINRLLSLASSSKNIKKCQRTKTTNGSTNLEPFTQLSTQGIMTEYELD